MIKGLLNWYKDYQLTKLQLSLDAKNKPYDTLIGVVQQLSASTNAQTAVLQEWMSGFKTTELTKSTVMRDVDEWQQEQERENAHGEMIINPVVTESIKNGIAAGAWPELKDVLNLI